MSQQLTTMEGKRGASLQGWIIRSEEQFHLVGEQIPKHGLSCGLRHQASRIGGPEWLVISQLMSLLFGSYLASAVVEAGLGFSYMWTLPPFEAVSHLCHWSALSPPCIMAPPIH